MPSLFAGFMGDFSVQTILGLWSAGMTAYLWVTRLNRERAGLKLFRLGDFRPDRLQCSEKPGKEKATWYGDVVLANPSTLPAAVVGFEVRLCWRGRWVEGRTVMERKDDVPWTVEPLRVLSRHFGCAFDVEEGTARELLLKPHRMRFTWTTVDGRKQCQLIDTCAAAASPALRLAA